jgi:small subunit ribosomal protein S17
MEKESRKIEEKTIKISKKNIDGTKEQKTDNNCNDINCPFHGVLSVRGRKFRGYVKKKIGNRIVIEFERIKKISKYERYAKFRTKIHARLPWCMKEKVNVGDYVEIGECRPLSKIVHHVFIRKISGEENKN